MTIEMFVLLIGGFLVLLGGAELLVRGASRLAAAFGISPLVIGLTVVAFGTSSPELAVSLKSTFAGQPDIALGNAVGSNIFNTLLILGLAALVTPLVVAQQLIRWDVPVMIAVSVLLMVFALDGHLSRIEGLVLFAGLLAYIFLAIRQSRAENAAVAAEYAAEFSERPSGARAILVNLLLVVGGLVALVLGARWLVDGAVQMARFFGVSELIIGLTVIAAGTSMPEVAASVVASLRGERDIAVGNVVGSNLFNILGILGLTSLLSADGLRVAAAALQFDIPVMIAAAILCLPIFFSGNRIDRWEGAIFLGLYGAYLTYLILDALQHASLPAFNLAMLVIVLPAVVLTLAVVHFREVRGRAAGP